MSIATTRFTTEEKRKHREHRGVDDHRLTFASIPDSAFENALGGANSRLHEKLRMQYDSSVPSVYSVVKKRHRLR